MAGRRTPPLFDLLGRNAGQGIGLPRVGSTRTPDAPPPPASGTAHDRGEQAVAEANAAAIGGVGTATAPPPQKPVVRVELKPMPLAAPTAQLSPTSFSPAREPGLSSNPIPQPGFWAEASGGRALRLPTVLAYVIVCGVVALLLGTWFTAYKLGNKAGKDQMAAFVRSDAPKVIEPDGSANPAPVPQNPATNPQPAAQPATQPGMAPVLTLDQLVAVSKPGGAMTARGWLPSDPRESGKNYLELATLQRDDAAKAVIYLTGSGQDAFAVPLDQKANPANNRSLRYRLIAWPGLTADEYAGGRGDQASRIQNAVSRLGKQWGGPSDFRMPQWVKFK
ncbi:MAG TPA: hypothetical protein VHN77_09060 [Phycisphaerales bacterium]|nr:hypothetical protein [Phycisphaerales bacterium]